MGWLSTIGSLFGGSSGSSSSSGVWGDIFKGVLSGLGSSAAAKANAKDTKVNIKDTGLEARKTTAYEMALQDYYKRSKDYKDSRALDNYGQFSRLNTIAPGYRPLAKVQDPGAPPTPQA